MNTTRTRRIHVCTVNHNTSPYVELLLRSLFARNGASLSPESNFAIAITVYDNGSQDDQHALRAYAASCGVPIIPSGFSTDTKHNSHGEVLSRFVLEQPECDYYLFLDADVCFLEDDTIGTLVRELEALPAAFGIGARMSRDGKHEVPADERLRLYCARLHPACALIRNTEVFRTVVREVGLSSTTILRARGGEFLDTLGLTTRVMKTHGLSHAQSSAMVLHFFCASYSTPWHKINAVRRDGWLRKLRSLDG